MQCRQRYQAADKDTWRSWNGIQRVGIQKWSSRNFLIFTLCAIPALELTPPQYKALRRLSPNQEKTEQPGQHHIIDFD
jgi:hypothetical protein